MVNINNIHVHSDQQEDGSFKHYVTFGDCAPWDTPESECVECVSETEAHKLKNIVSMLCGEEQATQEIFPGTLAALGKLGA